MCKCTPTIRAPFCGKPGCTIQDAIAFAFPTGYATDAASDDFAGYPVSIAEIASDKANDGAKWTPRDALICVLRMIDEGAKVDALVVCWRQQHDGAKQTAHFRQATPDPFVTFGLLSHTSFKLQD